jgi:endo-1,4-beta-xylanase
LRETVGKYFLIGTAVNMRQLEGEEPGDVAIICNQFNAVVAENCMKPEEIEPKEGVFTWDDADRFVKFAEDNHLTATGHVLIWHSQTPDWFFLNQYGEMPSRQVMIGRMRDYIHTVVGRYKGRIKGWDVVNEAITDDGELRDTPWMRAIGPDYIQLAFKFAHEADPNAELYYNDYSMDKPAKRNAAIKLVRQLRKAGCRVDAVGMQSHNGLDYPNIADYETSLKAFADAGIMVAITELDISALPNPWNFSGAEISQNFEMQKALNPYPKKLPKEVQRKHGDRYLAFFRLYKKYASNIKRVTLWGVSDGNSWLNDFPVKGRTNYPLLFDRQHKAKPVVEEICKLFSE